MQREGDVDTANILIIILQIKKGKETAATRLMSEIVQIIIIIIIIIYTLCNSCVICHTVTYKLVEKMSCVFNMISGMAILILVVLRIGSRKFLMI